MTTEPIRWAVLGAADFALEQMAPAIHAARGAQLVALATRDPAKAAPFRAFCPDLRVHDSYDAALADPDIDAVYIPLPNHLHVEWSLRALDAGKHVLCEKPMAMRAADYDTLIARREATGLLAAEAFMVVHHPQWQHVRDLLAEGAIGRLGHVNGLFSFDNRELGNIRNRPETGGGAIPDIGIYTLGGARFATGLEPEDLSARLTWENGVDVKAEITARLGGASFFSMLSMRLAPYQEMLFHGSDGAIRLRAPFNPAVFGEAEVELMRPGDRSETRRFPTARHYVAQVEAFVASLRRGLPYPWPLEQSRATQEAIDRAYAAAATG